MAADGVANVDIAARVGVCVDVASRWRKRFCEEGLADWRTGHARDGHVGSAPMSWLA
jgi:transposase